MKNSIRKIIFCVLVLLLSLPATMQLSRLTSFAQTTRNAGFTRQFLRMSSTSDMVYVVSAASRGIGLEFATQLLKQTDSKVVGITRSMSEENKSMHQLKDSFGDRFTMVHADLMDQKSIDLAGKKIADDFGRVDVLLNVAGILGKGVEGEGPERSIAAIDRTWFQKSLEVRQFSWIISLSYYDNNYLIIADQSNGSCDDDTSIVPTVEMLKSKRKRN